MNEAFRKVIEKAKDSQAAAASLKDQGITFLRSTVDQFPILQSLTASSSGVTDRDETHYLLVPVPDNESGYAVFTKRLIPAGHGSQNSLPKARIFHIPDEATKEILIEKIVAGKVLNQPAGKSEFADRLEIFADQVDRESLRVSGGLLLIGGAVAFINPLAGAGIALHSLLPSLGGKAAKSGAEAVSGKLRKWSEKAGLKKAENEVLKLKPEVVENPLLQILDAQLTNEQRDFDPILDSGTPSDLYTRQSDFRITLEAISAVYSDVVNRPDSLTKSQQQWLHHIMEMWEAIRETDH